MDSLPNVSSGPFAGRYTIERELATGATAKVYLAHDRLESRAVAIKVLKAELAEAIGTDRFLREIKLTARLHHPHIMPVLDSGNHEGRVYFVLPLMKDGTLRERMLKERQLPIKPAVLIARTVADALAYAHGEGLVHRDVKPENILFSGDDVCLADFGIARAIERSIDDPTTSTGIVRGTPAYMSPEQASGEHDYDGRSDVYSLACVLYEMIAGMPAFVGPSAKSIMAQRLFHPPRPVRVYRSTVPHALEEVIQRALEIDPPDRYATAAEFSEALDNALAVPSPSIGAVNAPPRERTIAATALPRTPDADKRGAAISRLPRKSVIAAGLLALGVIAAAVTTWAHQRGSTASEAVMADTTRIVLLPLEGRLPSAPFRDDDLLQQAVSSWRGINVVDRFQVTDALRQSDGIHSPGDAAAIARSLGAGRYIRGQTTPSGNSWRAYLALYDIGNPRPLHTAVEQIPADVGAATMVYSRLVESLLLRGAVGDSVLPGPPVHRSLPAVQAFGRAQLALDDWDLGTADSSFQSAVGFDPEYAKASLWLAQVRAWRDPTRTGWSPLAERAIALKAQLSQREQLLAEGLLRLAKGQPDSACVVYNRLRKQNSRDFAAWFGLGQCRSIDRIVVPHSSSPSGWRFRSSIRQAMLAYATAFEILPSVHRGYERGAFERLRELLLVSSDLRVGYGAQDSAVFYARPSWMGDTLALIPYPWQVVFAGDSSSIPPGFGEALRRRRAEFNQIASGWSEAFPRSAGAKHAVAISLDLLGNPTAIDTIRLARRLATEPARKAQLAAAEVLMLVKFGVPDDRGRLKSARALADSLLLKLPAKRVSQAKELAPIAAMSGRCSQLDDLVRLTVPAAGFQRIPGSMIADANVLVSRIAMGCSVDRGSIRVLSSAIARNFAGGKDDDRRRAEQILLYRAVILEPSLDSVVTDRIASGRGTDLLTAVYAASRKDVADARYALIGMEKKVDPGSPTPDITLARARLWLSIGDRNRAARTLDTSLESVRAYDPKVLEEPVNAAALVQAMALRSELAAAAGDLPNARRWSSAALILLSTADQDLRRSIQSISRYAVTR